MPDTQSSVPLDVPKLTFEQRRIAEQILPKSARNILESAETIELLSIEPCVASMLERRSRVHNQGLLGCTIVKSVFVTDATSRSNLLNGLYYGVAAGGTPMACWQPQHGIRASAKGRTVEIAICFQCSYLHGYVGNEHFDAIISGRPQALFNSLLNP